MRVTTSAIMVAALGIGVVAAPGDVPPYCAVASPGAAVEITRPGPSDPPLDDVNWFARPVPNPRGHRIVAVASHDLNYLHDLTSGTRIRIPDKSDAVATPDGRYVTVPSHYTSDHTINFYEAATLLTRLEQGRDAADVTPVYQHRHANVHDVFYQSVGVVSHVGAEGNDTTVYRMMFSGSSQPPMPGFRIVDYTFIRKNGALTVEATVPMRLCPQITRDLATPFISKDGRYVAAHDDSKAGRPASLKIFEILGTDPAAQTSTCAERVDFGFAAGKADFAFDGSALTFHISKYDYLTPFVSGGLKAPAITDVVVVDLVRDAAGRITGAGEMARVTTSSTEGVGHYFPAYFPDGKLFYVANLVPRDAAGTKRFELRVVDPARTRHLTSPFATPALREAAEAIGGLWREACAPTLAPFKPQEAAWTYMSLSSAQCRQLVEEKWAPANDPRKPGVIAACDAKAVVETPARAVDAGAFDEADLRELVAAEPRGLVYLWSPHMPLSVDGVAVARRVATRRHLPLTILLHPAANLDLARSIAIAKGWPIATTTRTASTELRVRNLLLHAPTLQPYAEGRLVGSALPGYHSDEEYALYLDRIFAGMP